MSTTFRSWFTSPFDLIIFTHSDPSHEEDPRWKDLPVNIPLTWDEASPWLDTPFDNGFGGQDCPNFTAWSPSHVHYVHEYDGSTCLHSVARNPPPRSPSQSGDLPKPPPLTSHQKQVFSTLLTCALIHEKSRSNGGPPSLCLLSGALSDGTPIGIISILDPQPEPDSSIILHPLALIPDSSSFFDTVTGPDGGPPTIRLQPPPPSPVEVARQHGIIVPPSP